MPGYDDVIKVLDEAALNIEDRIRLVDFINVTIRQSREIEAYRTKQSLKVGDTVVLSGLRPAYWNGQKVKVEKINKTRIVITTETRGRLTVPLSCVTKVEEE